MNDLKKNSIVKYCILTRNQRIKNNKAADPDRVYGVILKLLEENSRYILYLVI